MPDPLCDRTGPKLPLTAESSCESIGVSMTKIVETPRLITGLVNRKERAQEAVGDLGENRAEETPVEGCRHPGIDLRQIIEMPIELMLDLRLRHRWIDCLPPAWRMMERKR